ncbi:hypothetical protein Clacol_009821 [Clathrus columnatus]|uniref:Major facilitator superfamily (MFS) profile domain-containing protein n=1 Tax=Clathrus columnatus TaxID=1419009 RepID=A0AAV5APV4_9AGAM|nr:hypothetical protein Clacol_009821 [Clathrus columnatus]
MITEDLKTSQNPTQISEKNDERERPTYMSIVAEKLALQQPWYTNKRRVLLNILLANFADGYDDGLQSLEQWEESFNFPRGSRLALLAIIQRVGGIVVLPALPYFADGMGRRLTIFTGACIMIIGAIVQASSQNVGSFIGARQGGAVLAAWTTFGSFRVPNSWAWRIPSAVQALPALFQIAFVFLGPESPRWLVDKGRDAEALYILAYYHADGDEQDPLVRYEFQEIKTGIKLDRSAGWRDFLATPGNRRRLIVVIALAFFSQWSGNGLVAYYLSPVFDTIGITDPFTQLLVNALLSVENVLMALAAACLCDYIGRRTLFIISTTGMLIAFTLQTVFSSLYAQNGEKVMAHVVIAFIFLFYAAYDIAYSPLVGAYTVEIMPYTLRAKGLTIYYFAISVSFVFNQYVNPIALEKQKGVHSRKQPQTELSSPSFGSIFDGEDKIKAITDATVESPEMSFSQYGFATDV